MALGAFVLAAFAACAAGDGSGTPSGPQPPGTPPPRPPAPSPPTVPPAAPQLARIDGRIAFVRVIDRIQRVYITTSDSLTVRELTIGGQPAISSDGDRIAFTAQPPDGPSQIRVIDVDGTGERILTEGHSPAWSPDDRRIVFARFAGHGSAGGLYLIDADGGPATLLVDESSPRLGNTLSGPHWSPDGRRIAFTRDTDWFVLPSVAFVVNANGTGLHELVPEYSGRSTANPRWSAAGDRIAFIAYPSSLASVASTGGDFRVHIGNYPSDLTWSPDGRRLAYTRSNGVDARIFLVDEDGKEWRLIPEAPQQAGVRYSDWSPSWSRRRE